MDNIHILRVSGKTVAESDVEIVERKGIGHPDTICDAVMEEVSRALSREYLKSFGTILHHNCDKALLAAGTVEIGFGHGRVLEPMRLVMGDRATTEAAGKRVPVSEIAIDAARSWFRSHLRHVDTEKHVRYQVELRPGSTELRDAFSRASRPVANDTSAAVGYAPLSETERMVLETERYLNGSDFKNRFPDTGEDVKVMGIRRHSHLELILAMPLLAEHVDSEHRYFTRKEAIREDLLARFRGDSKLDLSVTLNRLDRQETGISGVYLSVLGTSAEDGDSGQVGRGNRVNGVIAFNRPGGSEAVAGKNPISHVGKIYNVSAYRLARRIHSAIPDIQQVTVWLCGRIGDPVDTPHLASVEIATGAPVEALADDIRRLVREELKGLDRLADEVVSGSISLW
jgi:S-adenosylmethionine synthetase